MLVQPKLSKYNKFFKGNKKRRKNSKLIEDKITILNLGWFGLRAIEHGRLSRRQLNCSQRILRHYIGRSVKIWVQPYPNTGVSKKPDEVRMGNGKGVVKYWSSYVKPGNIRFQVYGSNENTLLKGLKSAGAKRSIKSSIVKTLY